MQKSIDFIVSVQEREYIVWFLTGNGKLNKYLVGVKLH